MCSVSCLAVALALARALVGRLPQTINSCLITFSSAKCTQARRNKKLARNNAAKENCKTWTGGGERERGREQKTYAKTPIAINLVHVLPPLQHYQQHYPPLDTLYGTTYIPHAPTPLVDATVQVAASVYW